MSSPEVRIRNARKRVLSQTTCDVEDPLITLHWEGKTADVRLKSGAYSPEPADQAVPGEKPLPVMYLTSMESLNAARDDLFNLESKGCLTSREGQDLRKVLVERLSFPPDIAYLFRFGGYALTGVFDLNPDFRLQVIGPVYAAGATSSKQPIGYETANYLFGSARKDDRIRISLGSVTETDVGQTTPFQKLSPQNAFPFPESFTYFRLLFRTEESSANHIATIISAPDKAKLREATKQRESGPANSCQGVSAAGTTCIVFPPDYGVNGEMRIHVNGQEDFIRVEGSIDELLYSKRSIRAVPRTLVVRRLFQGHLVPVKFDPASQDIFGLVLMPGDEITW